ncbi:MAG: DUF5674 family protein [bacterium]|nr:DUF5674 family protein [bacterium]
MKVRRITEKVSPEEVASIVAEEFGEMAKVDVDIEKKILVVGGEWHSEGQDELVSKGSDGSVVWGCNFYPFREADKRIEYNSLINIKPAIGHTSMDIEDEDVKKQMRDVIETLLLSPNETVQR